MYACLMGGLCFTHINFIACHGKVLIKYNLNKDLGSMHLKIRML